VRQDELYRKKQRGRALTIDIERETERELEKQD